MRRAMLSRLIVTRRNSPRISQKEDLALSFNLCQIRCKNQILSMEHAATEFSARIKGDALKYFLKTIDVDTMTTTEIYSRPFPLLHA